MLADLQAQQRRAHWCQDRDGAVCARILWINQLEVVVLAADFFAAMHARIHGHNARRHFIVANHLVGAVQFGLQCLDARCVFILVGDKLFKTLYVEPSEDDRRCCGHGLGRLLYSP